MTRIGARHRRRARRAARPQRSATPSRAPAPARPYRAGGRRRPRASCASGCSRTTRSTPARSTPTASPPRDDAARAARVARPHRRGDVPGRARRPRRSSGTSPRCGPATLVYNLRYWERKVGREITPDDVEPLTWTLAEMGRAIDRARLRRRAARGARARRATSRQWYASGYDLLLTPTLGEPPVRARRRSATPDEPFARLHPRRDVRAVHAAREHDRPARDLAAAALERRQPADRRRS